MNFYCFVTASAVQDDLKCSQQKETENILQKKYITALPQHLQYKRTWNIHLKMKQKTFCKK